MVIRSGRILAATIYEWPEFVRVGGLVAYSADRLDGFGRKAESFTNSAWSVAWSLPRVWRRRDWRKLAASRRFRLLECKATGRVLGERGLGSAEPLVARH